MLLLEKLVAYLYYSGEERESNECINQKDLFVHVLLVVLHNFIRNVSNGLHIKKAKRKGGKRG